MAISFKKNDEELRKAWKAVIDDNNDTNWALFAYEKQSCELCVFNTGCGGLEELIDELNVASIMYAFCRVIDPKTELPKYVLINWQGEGAPLSRKGLCANHINDVSNFFRGAHITINARNEDEADPAYIVQKISMASGTKYSYKQRSDPIEDTAPVGTNYKKIQPHKEINVSERENFWTKQQEEEKRRKLEEKRRREENRVKIEKEERERELKDAKEREIICDRKDEEILKKREAEKNAENAARNELCRRLSLENKDNDEDEEMYVKRKQQELAKERSEETKKLLSQRSVRNARALFEQNTAAGQLSSIKISEQSIEYEPNIASAAPISPKESDIQRVYASEDSKNEEQIEQEEYVEDEDTEEEEELVEEEVYDVRQISQAMDAMQFGIKYSEPLEDIAEETEEITEGSEDQTTEKIFDDQLDLEKEVFSVLDQGLKARALYDYQAADETEISFDPDDIITHIEQIDEGWWQGMGPNGTYGLFPANYVELITE